MSVELLNKINRKLDYMDNRDKFLEYHRKWREKNKDKVKKYQTNQNKKYYQEHREELLAKAKERRKNKKDFESMWNKLKEYLLEEKEEVDVLIDPCAEEYEALCNISRTLYRIIKVIEETEKGE